MKSLQPIRHSLVLGLLAFASLSFAQAPSDPAQDPQAAPQQAPPAASGGWKRIGEGGANPANSPAPAPVDPQNPPAPQPPPQAPQTLPAQFTIKGGSYVTIRVNQTLSSDRNHVGDGFSATLERPIIVDGWVIAERGQSLGGRVSEVKKGHGGGGTSRLGVQLIDVPLSDGQQVPVQTQLISRQGPSTAGRDAGAIIGTTAFGAAVGAAAGWGTGAAIGAGAGFAAATIGVLLSHGYPSVIPAESLLTFRIDQPVTISTTTAPQTFRPVEPSDYQPPQGPSQPRMQTRAPGYPAQGYGYPGPGPAFYGPGYYPPFYSPYPYFWGPAFYGGFYYGPRGYFVRRW